MLGAAGALTWLKSHQKLGAPGVKTLPIPGSARLEILLPEQVMGYESELVKSSEQELTALPPDTSLGQRRYWSADGFVTALSVVLMGTDRTSLHKPQFCLPGGGRRIIRTERDRVRIYRPHPYDLPVVKLTTSRDETIGGQTGSVHGVYVYWYVCDDAFTAEAGGGQRMWWMARELVRTGILQRWAYVTCFSECAPGQEEETFKRMRRFLALAVPEFQLVAGPASGESSSAATP
jgi:hypothetical protein